MNKFTLGAGGRENIMQRDRPSAFLTVPPKMKNVTVMTFGKTMKDQVANLVKGLYIHTFSEQLEIINHI